jgi:hypothetical protein
MISADAIARAIAFAIEQPSGIDVNEIVIRPSAQASKLKRHEMLLRWAASAVPFIPGRPCTTHSASEL